MKIIFLDIDGVIVPDYQKVNDQAFSKHNEWDAEPFSKLGMIILNKILITTNAKIVISSDWRLNYSLQEIKNIFCAAGVIFGEDVIIGFTRRSKYGDYISNRAEEILDWVAIHRPEHWVAIDDLDLSSYLPVDNFVHCKKPNEGLKQTGLRREIEIKLGN